MLEIFENIRTHLNSILDKEDLDLSLESYLIRDLNMESIDMLELAVSLSDDYKIYIDDQEAFLSSLRSLLNKKEASLSDEELLKKHYPHLSKERIGEILQDLSSGATVKIKDVISYIQFHKGLL